MRKVRKLRHWKQRWNPNARFIWRRAVTWKGKQVKIGDPTPKDVPKAKLRRFWESKVIELAEFEDPNVATGRVEKPSDKKEQGGGEGRKPDDLVSKEADRKWVVEGVDDKTFPTKKAALEAAEELIAQGDGAEDGDGQPDADDEQPDGSEQSDEQPDDAEEADGQSEDETEDEPGGEDEASDEDDDWLENGEADGDEEEKGD